MNMLWIGIMHLAVICIFFHILVVIDLIKKFKSKPRKIKPMWFWLSNFPIFGPIFYISSNNYNNKEASSRNLFFLIMLYALLIALIIIPLRMISFMTCSVIAFVLYFIFVYIVSKKFSSRLKESYILLACLLGCSILDLPLRILQFSSTLVSFPDFLFHLFGILMGYLFYKSNRIVRISILAFSLLSCLFLYYKGYDMWLHKVSFGTFTGKIESKQSYDLFFQTNSGDTLSLSDFKGKYLLLDCWYTYCGVCYQKMPEMQQLYDNYKQDPEISIYAMHSFMKKSMRNVPLEDYTTGSEILKKKGFNYPCLSIDIESPVLKELGVDVYPTVLIFDRQSNLIFRGSIENASNSIKKLLQKTNNVSK